MAKVGTAEYDVEISRAKVQAEVDRASKQIEDGFDKSSKKVSAGLSETTKAMAAGFAAFAGAKVIGDSVKAASDLAESQSKVGVVFGESSAAVEAFAESSATAFGQSKAQALEATGTFGNLFRSIGLTEEQSASFSTTLTGLASDLASFNNTSVDDALNALRSGLVGETEPLKAFGVNMNEATLKAKALELGLSDGKGVLDANAKAQAAYALIMEQTTLAQGDFARTSDGLANQQRILNAEWQDSKAKLGAALIPAAKTATSVLGDLLGVVSDMPPELQAAAIGAVGLALAGPKIAQAWNAVAGSLGNAQSALTSTVSQVGYLKSAGVALLAGVAAYNATYKAIEQLTSSKVDVQDLADAVRFLGESGEGLGDVVDQFGGAEDLAAKVKLLSDALTDADHNTKRAGNALVDLARAGAAGVDGLDAAKEAWGQFFSDVLDADAHKAQDEIGQLDAILAALAKQDPSAATTAFRELIEALKANGATTEEIALLFPKYLDYRESEAGKTAAAAQATEQHTASVKSNTEAMEDAAKAAGELYDTRVGLVDAQENVANSMLAIQDAEQGVVDAERAEADATQAVTDAKAAEADARQGVQDAIAAEAEARRGVQDAMRAEADAAQAVVDAQADVATATQDLADARRAATGDSDDMRDALEGVARAEQAVANADRDSIDAQRELDQVRSDYAQTLANLSDAAGGAADDVLRAEIALRRAQQARAELGKDGKPVTADDRTEADIAIREAQRRLNAARQAAAEAQADLERNQANGVEGSDAYAAAQDAVTAATQAQTDAHHDLEGAVQNVADTQTAADEAVQTAEENLASAVDAVNAAQQKRIDAHQAVIDAQAKVAEAARGVRDAEKDVADRMADVAKAEQDRVEAADGVVTARDKVKKATDDYRQAVIDAAKAEFDATGDVDKLTKALADQLAVMDPNSPYYQAAMAYYNALPVGTGAATSYTPSRDPDAYSGNRSGSWGAKGLFARAVDDWSADIVAKKAGEATRTITADLIAAATLTPAEAHAQELIRRQHEAAVAAIREEARRHMAQGIDAYKQWLAALAHLFAMVDLDGPNGHGPAWAKPPRFGAAADGSGTPWVAGTPFNWGDELRKFWAAGGVTWNMPDTAWINELRTNGPGEPSGSGASLVVHYDHVTRPEEAARQTADLWGWEMSQMGRY